MPGSGHFGPMGASGTRVEWGPALIVAVLLEAISNLFTGLESAIFGVWAARSGLGARSPGLGPGFGASLVSRGKLRLGCAQQPDISGCQ